MANGNQKTITVVDFQTEKSYDILEVNGQSYSGSSGPEGVVPAGTMKWDSAP